MASADATINERLRADQNVRPESMDRIFATLETQRIAAIKALWFTVAKCLLSIPFLALPLGGTMVSTLDHPAGTALAAFAESVKPLIQPYAEFVFLGSAIWLFGGLVALGRFFVRRGRQPGWNYVHNFKSVVLNHLCEVHFPGLAYDPQGYVGYDEFDGTKLFAHTSDEYRSEDYFAGAVGNTDVRFAEVVAKRERRAFRKGRLETYLDEFFHGLVFVAEFHKHFHCTMRLVPRDEKLAKVRGQQVVVMEDPDFEEAFATVSTDQVDAHYILSTSMVGRIVKLNGRFPGMRALFKDDKLVLALPSFGDKFEPSLYSRARSPEQLATFVADIRKLLLIVEELDLNTRIWSKA